MKLTLKIPCKICGKILTHRHELLDQECLVHKVVNNES